MQKERLRESLDPVTSDFLFQYEKARSFEVEGVGIDLEFEGKKKTFKNLWLIGGSLWWICMYKIPLIKEDMRHRFSLLSSQLYSIVLFELLKIKIELE